MTRIDLALSDDFVPNFDLAIGGPVAGAACGMIHILRPLFFFSKSLIVVGT